MSATRRLPKRVYFVVYESGVLASEEVFLTKAAARRDISSHFKTTERVVGATLTLDRVTKSKKRNPKDPT